MRITLVAFIWLIMSAATPSFGGVGDVYYCILDRGYSWDNSEKTLREILLPRFTFTQKTENLIKFSDDFMGLPIHEYKIINETIVSEDRGANYRFWFDGENFKYTIFQSPDLSDYIGFFTCSKF